jgi:hypothetical protein
MIISFVTFTFSFLVAVLRQLVQPVQQHQVRLLLEQLVHLALEQLAHPVQQHQQVHLYDHRQVGNSNCGNNLINHYFLQLNQQTQSIGD